MPVLIVVPVAAQDAVWRSYFGQAQKSYQSGNYADAEKLLTSALDAARKYDDSLNTFFYLAHTLEKQGQYAQAEGYYKTVLEYLGPKVWATMRLPEGTLEWDQTSSVDSDALNSTQFVQQFPHQKEPFHTRLAKPITTVDVLADLASLFQLEHKYDQAEQTFRQALELSEHRPNAASISQTQLMQKLATLYNTEGKSAESAALLKQLDDVRNACFPGFNQLVEKNLNDLDRFGKNGVLVATRLNNLALFCATHGDYIRAEMLYNRALENCKTSPVERRDVAIIVRNFADLLQAMGRNDEALRYLQDADTYKEVVDKHVHVARDPSD